MKLRLFYGWYIVVAAALIVAYNSWLFVYGWTAFINPIAGTFGWSMTQIALASSLRGIETGFFNPIWGSAVDRFSARKLLLVGLGTTATGIIFLSQTRNLAMFYAGFLIMGVGSSLITGMLPVTVIARWFRKGIGKANGLYYTGTAFGGVMVPVLVIVVDRLGWPTTLLYAGFGMLLIGLPFAWVMRSRPEEKGLAPDGDSVIAVSGTTRTARSDFGVGVKEAFRMRAFWHLVAVTLFQNSYLATLQTFTMPYLLSVGMEKTTAALVITVYTVMSMATRIPFGVLGDRFKKTHVMALSIVLQTAGLGVFALMHQNSPFWLIILFGLTYGVGIAGVMPMRSVLIAEYFGTRNFGKIFGISSIFITLAGVISAPMAGWVFDTWGDFRPYWLAGVGMGIMALAATLTMPPAPKHWEGIIKPVR